MQRRFANAMTDYGYGVLSQVEVCSLGQNPSLEEVLALRRWSAGVSPLFPLVEYGFHVHLSPSNGLTISNSRYAHKLSIPDEVFECESIKQIEQAGVDFVVL